MFLAPPRRAVLLTGLAGAGKTQLLRELSSLGEQIINLEHLANHSGSAFGGLGRSAQPSHKTFQSLVCDAWVAADPAAPLWIEEEGPFIGSVGLPSWLLDLFHHLPAIAVCAGRDHRISRLLEEYGSFSQTDLEAAVNKLRDRLSPAEAEHAIQAIRAGRVRDAIDVVLTYYDDAYRCRMARQPRKTLCTFSPCVDKPVELARLVRSVRDRRLMWLEGL